jgi:hypothetical protein
MVPVGPSLLPLLAIAASFSAFFLAMSSEMLSSESESLSSGWYWLPPGFKGELSDPNAFNPACEVLFVRF